MTVWLGAGMGYLATQAATAPFWRIHVFRSDGWVEMHGETRLIIKTRGEEILDFPPFDSLLVELAASRDELEAIVRSSISGKTISL